MGFNAIWISPVVTNYGNGYHGYWASDLYSINPHFGGEAGLKALISACHSRDIWVMVDIVANHMGTDISQIGGFNPFNSSSDYHDCSGCPSNCVIANYNNAYETEHCRTAGLPDLNQDNAVVKNGLTNWIRWLGTTFDIDGYRVDTVPEVKKEFWNVFQQAAGMFAIGEVFNGDPVYVGGYQNTALNSLLSYPMYFTLKDVFGSKKSMRSIESRLQQYTTTFPDVSILGNFVDNHDNPRFLSFQGDQQLFKNALTYTLTAAGIPIMYYGNEQGFAGGADPNNREPLWNSFNTGHPLYLHVATVNKARNAHISPTSTQIQRYSDDGFYAYTRGTTFVALTNSGSSGGSVSRSITYHPYASGNKICNVFYPTTDCITISGGAFTVYLANGESKIYVLQ